MSSTEAISLGLLKATDFSRIGMQARYTNLRRESACIAHT